MLRKGLFMIVLLVGQMCFAQLGIGTLHPHSSAQLEVTAAHRGVLIPRIALQGIHDHATITSGNIESLLVYNTTHSNILKPGFYYWHHQQWHRLLNGDDLPENILFWEENLQQIRYRSADGDLHTIPQVNGAETLTYLKMTLDDQTLLYIDELGDTTQLDFASIVTENQKNVELIDGNHTTISTTINGNTTTYQVGVPVAQSSTQNNSAQLGLVREKFTNPKITIGQNGALLLNTEHLNRVKVVVQDYTATLNDKIIFGNTTTTNLTISLPNPVVSKGKIYIIKKENTGEDFYLFVQGQIAGIPTGQHLYTAVPFTGWQLVSDGNEWQIINTF